MTCVLDAVPLEPESITREWLLEVINQYRRSKGLSVLGSADCIEHCNIDECESSHGFLSTTFKLVVHFCLSKKIKDDTAVFDTYAFFLKMVPGVDAKHKSLMEISQCFPHEVESQFRILPLIRAFLLRHSKSQNCKKNTLPSPDIVYGSYEASNGGILLLLDVNNQGFFNNTNNNGLDIHQLLIVAEKLAELHAASASWLVVEPEQLQKLVGINDAGIVEASNSAFGDLTKLLRRTPGLMHTARLLDFLRPKLLPLMVKRIRQKKLEMDRFRFGLRCVVHGELWEQNLLFRTEAISEQMDVVFCDWKRLRVAHPAHDLALLMLASTSQSSRSRLESQVLEKYFFSLNESVRRLGFRLQGDLMQGEATFDDFKQDYYSTRHSAFIRAVPLLMRQVQYLEMDFHNTEKLELREELGLRLRYTARRLLDLTEEFLPDFCNNDNNDKVELSALTLNLS